MDSAALRTCDTCVNRAVDGREEQPFCWECRPSVAKLRWHPIDCVNTKVDSAWNKQVDGSHYKDCPIQPFQYSMANNLDPMQHTAIKYITRFRKKGGIRDLEAAIHTIELLIEWTREHGLDGKGA